MAEITVIMTTYNLEYSVKRAVESVMEHGLPEKIELVIVDDCSLDGTVDQIRELQRRYTSIRFYQMEENSGGPSAPRNLGIKKATSEYVTFLDGDDEIIAKRLLEAVAEVRRRKLDFVKGKLLINHSGEQRFANEMECRTENVLAIKKAMVHFLSLTCDFIIRRQLLLDQDIWFGSHIKMGEDTLLSCQIMSVTDRVGYLDNYWLIYHTGREKREGKSMTHSWGDEEVLHQMEVWKKAGQFLLNAGISYYDLRLPRGVRNILTSLPCHSRGLSEPVFRQFHEFLSEVYGAIHRSLNLAARYQDICDAVLSGDYQRFRREIKPRLFITGYDLKFIRPVLTHLEERYAVQTEEWSGHQRHDEKEGRAKAAWADIIWCEWMLENAVFYSKIRNANQKLVIRAHRFELGRAYGNQVDYSRVNAVFCVGYYYMERFGEQFAIPRKLLRLLSNYVETGIYSREKSPDFLYHIGICGILPARKGFHRGLELLKRLVSEDTRYRLYIMGQRPEEVDWICSNPSEMEYYSQCESYIREQGLTEHVVYTGWRPRQELYRESGFILSLSDQENPESFHLSPAEGAAAGCLLLIRRWPGAEYIYPPQILFEEIDNMAEQIVQYGSAPELFRLRQAELFSFIEKEYGIDEFLKKLELHLEQVMEG